MAAIQQLSREFKGWFSEGCHYRVLFDNARQHTSKKAKEGLADMDLPVMDEFPPQSWDLNAIEGVWAWQMQKMRGHQPRTKKGWEKLIRKSWDEIAISNINKVIAKVPQQVQRIIEEDGEWVKWFP